MSSLLNLALFTKFCSKCSDKEIYLFIHSQKKVPNRFQTSAYKYRVMLQIGTGWWNVNEPGQNHGTIMEAMKATFPTASCMNNFFVYRKIWYYLIKPIILSFAFPFRVLQMPECSSSHYFPYVYSYSFWKENWVNILG